MNKKDFIEIPFGAKDSELIKFEYTIPEGYEAIIENGKVIVKKMESEDEKIRKEIVRFIQMEVEDEIVGNKWLAWLEKQGEQKFAEWSEEDCYVYNEVLKRVADGKLYEHDLEYIYTWLKSFKDRVQPQWKPSEEQIQALEYQVHSTYAGSWQYKASKELLEQLKKL